MQPTARSLTLDLLSTMRRGSMPVRALVAAAELFDIEENSLRVNLARLLASGSIERDEPGRYRLARTDSAFKQQVLGWRGLESRVVDAWSGDLVAVIGAPTGRRGPARLSSRALAMLGFRSLRPGLHVRPDNLAGGVDGVRERYLGLCDADSNHARASVARNDAPIVAKLSDVAELDTSAARELWDAAGLEREYARLSKTLAESETQLDSLPASEAMVESFLVGGRVLRALNVDPLLPAPIIDDTARRALVESMRRYDLLGRAKWSQFLAHHGAPVSLHASQADTANAADLRSAPTSRIH